MGIAAVLAMLMLTGGRASTPATPQPSTDQRPSDPGPPIPEPESPVSVERIREGLQRPGLKIPQIDPTPVFRATVEVEAPLETPLQAMRRELAENPGGHGGSGFDILPAIMGIVKQIKAARRAHMEAEIRKEVQAEIDAFCVEHDCSVLEGGPLPLEGIILPRRRTGP